MNKIILTGRIANDLEIRKTQNNKSILEFNLAVRRDRKDSNGNYPADFLKIVCWEQRADFLVKYAAKGVSIGVSGRLETNTYTNSQGQKVYSTYIVAEQVEILSKPEQKEASQEAKTEITISQGTMGAQIDGIGPEELPFF